MTDSNSELKKDKLEIIIEKLKLKKDTYSKIKIKDSDDYSLHIFEVAIINTSEDGKNLDLRFFKDLMPETVALMVMELYRIFSEDIKISLFEGFYYHPTEDKFLFGKEAEDQIIKERTEMIFSAVKDSLEFEKHEQRQIQKGQIFKC